MEWRATQSYIHGARGEGCRARLRCERRNEEGLWGLRERRAGWLMIGDRLTVRRTRVPESFCGKRQPWQPARGGMLAAKDKAPAGPSRPRHGTGAMPTSCCAIYTLKGTSRRDAKKREEKTPFLQILIPPHVFDLPLGNGLETNRYGACDNGLPKHRKAAENGTCLTTCSSR